MQNLLCANAFSLRRIQGQPVIVRLTSNVSFDIAHVNVLTHLHPPHLTVTVDMMTECHLQHHCSVQETMFSQTPVGILV